MQSKNAISPITIVHTMCGVHNNIYILYYYISALFGTQMLNNNNYSILLPVHTPRLFDSSFKVKYLL